MSALRPAGRVLFVSGCTEDHTLLSGFQAGRPAFVQKPFGTGEPLAAVRRAPGAPPR